MAFSTLEPLNDRAEKPDREARTHDDDGVSPGRTLACCCLELSEPCPHSCYMLQHNAGQYNMSLHFQDSTCLTDSEQLTVVDAFH